MFVTSYSVTYCIHIPGKPGICFIIFVQFMMSANSRIRFGLNIVFVYLYITPSHIIIVQTNLKTLNCVSKIRHILSVIHYTIRRAVCFQFTHFPCDDYHHQIGSMNYYHCLGLGHETMVSAACLSVFLFLRFMKSLPHWSCKYGASVIHEYIYPIYIAAVLTLLNLFIVRLYFLNCLYLSGLHH